MDPSLSGLLGAYGSEDEDENEDLLIPSPGIVVVEGTKAGVSPPIIPLEGATVSAALTLPLSAAPDVGGLGEPGNLQNSAEEQHNGEAKAEAEQLDKFWLPEEIAQEPQGKCPADVQEKVREYIHIQEETGNTITSSLKALSGYKNPDFLQHCVKYDNINQYGSCYPKDVFDPEGLPKEDYYDRLAYEWKQEELRKEAARKASQRSEFVSGGTEQTRALPPGLQSTATAQEMVAQVKRVAARSKWDSRH